MYSLLGTLLAEHCSAAQRLVLIAPYIKIDALNKVLSSFDSEASLICVTRWNPNDIAVGASDTECRTIVKEFGGSFRLHPTLHAKYYRMDDVMLVGSANLTLSALGWSAQPNLEILCRASNDFDAEAFERKVLSESREISDDEFARWESIVRIEIPIDNTGDDITPSLNTWRPATRDPRHLELSYQDKDDEIASLDEQRSTRYDLQNLQIPQGLSNNEFRAWASTYLLAAPFTNTVLQLINMEDPIISYRTIATKYGLSMTEARRSVEAVQSWLVFFAPETISNTLQIDSHEQLTSSESAD